MSQFRTVVSTSPSTWQIGQKDAILTLGSCFSDAMGHRLVQNKFHAFVNPFGTIYNPASLHRLITYSILNELPPAFTDVRRDDIHLNYDFHSSFSSLDPGVLRHQIAQSLKSVHTALKSCRYVLITYGTSWVYTLKNHGHVVANCHKMPSGLFTKHVQDVNQVVHSFNEMNTILRAFNPDVRIILTVSPVRHVKDTIPLNMVSKSVLRLACHRLAEEFPHVEYFPACEIMLDDLRDYRFYKPDMIHPTEQAEDYIWSRFTKQYMDTQTQQFVQQWKALQAALHHKPFHPSSSGHILFLKDTLRKLEEIQRNVDVDVEIRAIKAQLEEFST